MIHRALFGSIERFFAVLLEHAGAFPAWLGARAGGRHPDRRRARGVLAVVRHRGGRTGPAGPGRSAHRHAEEVPNAQKQKVPFMVIAGDEDMAAGAVSFRYPPDGSQERTLLAMEAITKIMRSSRSAHRSDAQAWRAGPTRWCSLPRRGRKAPGELSSPGAISHPCSRPSRPRARTPGAARTRTSRSPRRAAPDRTPSAPTRSCAPSGSPAPRPRTRPS